MHVLIKHWLVVVFAAAALAACGQEAEQQTQPEPSRDEGERLNAFFEEAFERELDSSPMMQSYLGIKKDYDKWDDLSDEKAQRDIARIKADLQTLRTEFDFDALNEKDRLSYRLFEREVQDRIDMFRWRNHIYPINQMFGWQQTVPAFLINVHRIADKDDAQDYIARLNKIPQLTEQISEQLAEHAEIGVVAPEFVFPKALEDARNVLIGAPFDDSGADSPLWADFKSKIAALELDAAQAETLLEEGEQALLTSFKPGWEALIAAIERNSEKAQGNNGAWSLPDGAAYYEAQLRSITTTDMTAQEIHDLGLAEMDRIHGEMRLIMEQVEFDGSLQEFFEFMRTDEQFYLPQTQEGREQYLSRTQAIIDNMRARLDDAFGLQPQAELIVKPVEPFREKSAGIAFYQRPAPDGSRPGTYYVNLSDMADMPIFEMEALAYHEGIPGHHMQIAIAQELQGIPKFRRFGGYTAYVEGWGLYSEKLPKEMGFYQDPYSDFGRLAMELWRAARLVVDTGLHDKRWTREETIDYLMENTPNGEGEIVKAAERYLVMPGQATAYKIGMLKILELRELARESLGEEFDIREFHDVVLGDGAVPLSILEENVNDWIASTRPPV